LKRQNNNREGDLLCQLSSKKKTKEKASMFNVMGSFLCFGWHGTKQLKEKWGHWGGSKKIKWKRLG